jgi:hypothetical protein
MDVESFLNPIYLIAEVVEAKARSGPYHRPGLIR